VKKIPVGVYKWWRQLFENYMERVLDSDISTPPNTPQHTPPTCKTIHPQPQSELLHRATGRYVSGQENHWNCCHQMSHFKAKMHQIRFRLRLRPRPGWGSLQRSPRPPSWILGVLLLREGKEENKKGRGRGREGEGRQRKGEKGMEMGEEGRGKARTKFSHTPTVGGF